MIFEFPHFLHQIIQRFRSKIFDSDRPGKKTPMFAVCKSFWLEHCLILIYMQLPLFREVRRTETSQTEEKNFIETRGKRLCIGTFLFHRTGFHPFPPIISLTPSVAPMCAHPVSSSSLRGFIIISSEKHGRIFTAKCMYLHFFLSFLTPCTSPIISSVRVSSFEPINFASSSPQALNMESSEEKNQRKIHSPKAFMQFAEMNKESPFFLLHA